MKKTIETTNAWEKKYIDERGIWYQQAKENELWTKRQHETTWTEAYWYGFYSESRNWLEGKPTYLDRIKLVRVKLVDS